MKDLDLIRKLTLFSGLPDEELEKILEITLERKYKKNMIIFMEDEPGEAIYYVKSGKVKVFRSYEDGREHIIHILSDGDIFGEATLFSDRAYPASASTYEDSVIGIIRNSDLEKLVLKSPELSLKLIKILAAKLVMTQKKIKELTFNDVFSRTASQLLKLADDHGLKTGHGVMIDMTISRQELADMAGTTRETISRVLSRFKKEKSITEQDDKIVILNADKLKQWN